MSTLPACYRCDKQPCECPTHIGLFEGSGIPSLAAREAGFRTVAQCESDPFCQYVLSMLWPDSVLFKDVHDVSAESLRAAGVAKIDIISGGFPCQDLSTAGRGKGIEGSRSGLWREMFRVIRQVRPAWLVVENVPVVRVRGVDRVIAPLERIGYTCWPLVAPSWSAGCTTRRRRAWVVGKSASNDGQVLLCSRRSFKACPNAGRPSGVGKRGQPQHDWEIPRLAQFGLGDAVDGLPARVRSRANKALLRMVGNAWCYPVAELIFRWIAEQIAANRLRQEVLF